MEAKRIKLWDLPTRIFHWALVVLVAVAVITAQVGGNAMDWHGRIGLAIVGLIAFRLVWGFIGSTPSRFASFAPTPATISAYLRGEWPGVGHNPLGALSVFALLAAIVVQFSTGLFANDDIAFSGPLAFLVSGELSHRLTEIHESSSNVLFALVALHVGAIAYYALVKKEKLIGPMITGWKELSAREHANAGSREAGIVAFVVALLVALAAVYAASGVWIARSI